MHMARQKMAYTFLVIKYTRASYALFVTISRWQNDFAVATSLCFPSFCTSQTIYLFLNRVNLFCGIETMLALET